MFKAPDENIVQANPNSSIEIYIMEKDSKKFYIYNSQDQSVTSNLLSMTTNFPHNF